MPIRQAALHIKVMDGTGTVRSPGANDKVLANGTPLPFDAADGFKMETLTTGEIELVIQYQGFAELRQWFDVEAPAERPKLIPFWHGTDSDATAPGEKRSNYLLECINIMRNAGGSDADRSPTVFLATVTLYPTLEYIAAIGSDYWEGAFGPSPHKAGLEFLKYSVTYANHLYEGGNMNVSSPFTMLDCQRGLVEVWMRAATKGWRRQFVRSVKTPAPGWSNSKSFRDWIQALQFDKTIPSTQYLGATDIYRYISGIGTTRPGTVKDFSVFSHAWAGGPILYNTSYDKRTTTRTDTDLDMRYEQDFISPNVANWPKLREAFASSGLVDIWGCLATNLYRDMVIYLLTTKPPAKFHNTNRTPPVDMDRSEVITYLQQVMDDYSYMKRIAQHTGCHAYGGPPGYGAEWKAYGDLPAVPAGLKSKIRGTILHVPATFQPNTRIRKLFESAELGARDFDSFGYLLYLP